MNISGDVDDPGQSWLKYITIRKPFKIKHLIFIDLESDHNFYCNVRFEIQTHKLLSKRVNFDFNIFSKIMSLKNVQHR